MRCRPRFSILSRILVAVILPVIGWAAHSAGTGYAAGGLQTIAVVGGQPDDITVDARGRLVWGNLSRGTIERLDRGRVVTVARGLSLPEGVIALADGSLIVAEQGRDRIDRISPGGAVSDIFTLTPVYGQEGVDGIGRDTVTGDILVPDSPNGRVIRMSIKGQHPRVIASGLGRPVDAVTDRYGNVLVPDEHLGTVVVVSRRGHVSYRGRFPTPDDVSVDTAGNVWVTSLGDNGLWIMRPGAAPQRILTGLAYPQGMTLDRCSDPVVTEQYSGRIVRLLLSSKSARCQF